MGSTNLNLDQAGQLIEEFKQILPLLGQQSETVTEHNETPSLLDLAKANQLIKSFDQLKFPPERKKTFMEIIGLSHLENVSSKILQFFLNTEEQHGLGDLALQALLQLAGNPQRHSLKTEEVSREVECKDDHGVGRIDLLIRTQDHLLLIENKLNHHTNSNPFERYIAHAVDKFSDYERTYILLGLKKPEKMPEQFVYVSHFELAKILRSEVGRHWSHCDHYYIHHLFDYLNALETLNNESEFGKMQQAIVDFYRKNRELFEQIEENTEYVHQYYENQLRQVVEELKQKNLDIFDADVEYWHFESELLSHIGGSFESRSFSSIPGSHTLDFWIGKSTTSAILGFSRYEKLWNKQATKDAVVFLERHDIACPFHEDKNIYLLELPETTSPEEFATQAAPIIQKLLDIHGIGLNSPVAPVDSGQ